MVERVAVDADAHGDVVVARSEGKWITTGDPKNYFLAHLEFVLSKTDYANDVKKLIKEYEKEDK